MDELFNFIIKSNASKYDLIKIAIAHHRFVWIHPFSNGNGRTVRLFTYAMLVKQNFNVNSDKIINPTAVFCNDRDSYYKYLSKANTGTKQGIIEWIEYVLNGLKVEIKKTDKLLDYSFLSEKILLKALSYCKNSDDINEREFKILQIAIKKQVFQSLDLKGLFVGKKHSSEISRSIKKLKDFFLIITEKENGRKYVLSFKNKFLLKNILKSLDEEGFLPKGIL